jgi:uncharacterized SAM-binding protein YcdF (DUF218 family)
LNTVPSGGIRRRSLLVIAALLVAAAAYAFIELGSFLAKEDPLQRADAIFVLAGTEMTRPLEGADLYLAHYAPVIVMTRETAERAVAALRQRGPVLASDVERARDALIELGVPRDALILPDRIHDSTAAEAITLRELAQKNGWHHVIVVTSKLHLRRAGFAMRRELRGTGVEVMMHATRYDDARPERWWTRRGDIREMISEVPKLIAYLLGLGA